MGDQGVSRAPSARWYALPGVAVLSLLPLALCLTGVMEIGAVIFAYAVEGMLVTILSEVEEWRAKAVGLGTCIVAAVLAFEVMTWDEVAPVGIVLFVVTGWVSAWWSARERELPFAEVYAGAGPFVWRLLVVGMGFVGLLAARDYKDLTEHGWTPAPHEAYLPLDLDPMVIPAVAFVMFKAVNEVLFEVLSILGDENGPRKRPGRHL